jgi:hypothetical protein
MSFRLTQCAERGITLGSMNGLTFPARIAYPGVPAQEKTLENALTPIRFL